VWVPIAEAAISGSNQVGIFEDKSVLLNPLWFFGNRAGSFIRTIVAHGDRRPSVRHPFINSAAKVGYETVNR
jgi:hypothetical protein